MSELSRWLEEEAKLTGTKLQKTTELCEAHFVLDLNDLRKMADRGNLKEIFPQVVLRDMIEQALNLDTSLQQIKMDPRQTQQQPSTTAQMPAKQHLHDSSLLSLPPGKLYGCFASHKKTHTKYADACEVCSFDCV